jgi:hypothetical protein
MTDPTDKEAILAFARWQRQALRRLRQKEMNSLGIWLSLLVGSLFVFWMGYVPDHNRLWLIPFYAALFFVFVYLRQWRNTTREYESLLGEILREDYQRKLHQE